MRQPGRPEIVGQLGPRGTHVAENESGEERSLRFGETGGAAQQGRPDRVRLSIGNATGKALMDAAKPEAPGQVAGIVIRTTDRERNGRTRHHEFVADAQRRSTELRRHNGTPAVPVERHIDPASAERRFGVGTDHRPNGVVRPRLRVETVLGPDGPTGESRE